MLKRAVFFLAILSMLPLVAGCWFLVGAGAGYEITSDSAKGHFDTSFTRAYQVSLDIIKSQGNISMDDEKEGWIKADINNYKTAVHIERLTERTVQITVSARKYALPKPQFARDILSRISKKLK